MKRMPILIALSIMVLLTLGGVSIGSGDSCSYSCEMDDYYYGGCFCDSAGSNLCAGTGYMHFTYPCDGSCPDCEMCHYWKDSYDRVFHELYPVCKSINESAPWCGDDGDCERVSWIASFMAAPDCRCW